MSDLSDRISTDATKPQASTVDGVSITRRSLSEMVEADKYLRGINATDPQNMAATFLGMNHKIVSTGAQG